MSSFVFSPAAQQDLYEIWAYISSDSPERAHTFLDEIEEKCKILARYPQIGHRRPDLTRHSVLFWPIYRYLIIYKQVSNPLEIVRILSGYRDLVEILL